MASPMLLPPTATQEVALAQLTLQNVPPVLCVAAATTTGDVHVHVPAVSVPTE
jgi:hypothetical protein